MKKLILLILLHAHAHASTTIGNSFSYVPGNNYVSWWMRDLSSAGSVTNKQPGISMSIWHNDDLGAGSTRYELNYATKKATTRLYLIFQGCTIDNQPVYVKNNYNIGFAQTDTFSRYENQFFGNTGETRLMGKISSTNGYGHNTYINVAHAAIARGAAQQYGNILPSGEYEITCTHDWAIDDAVFATTTLRGPIRMQQYPGSPSYHSGFYPNVINLSTRTGHFTTQTNLAIPAVAGGTLTVTSDLPISIDFGAGPSTEATSVTTHFTDTGLATGLVTIKGTLTDPGLYKYNLRAVSIYQ